MRRILLILALALAPAMSWAQEAPPTDTAVVIRCSCKVERRDSVIVVTDADEPKENRVKAIAKTVVEDIGYFIIESAAWEGVSRLFRRR